MSLINDALKRAQAAETVGAAAGPALQPTGPGAAHSGRAEVWVATLLGVVLALVGMLLWQWFHAGRAVNLPQVVAGSTTPPVNPEPPAPAIPPKPEPVMAAIPAAAVVATPATNQPPPVIPSQPPTFRLQSIIYRGTKSSALINGRDVIIGSRLSGARVVAIDLGTVTLVNSAGVTNVLELPGVH